MASDSNVTMIMNLFPNLDSFLIAEMCKNYEMEEIVMILSGMDHDLQTEKSNKRLSSSVIKPMINESKINEEGKSRELMLLQQRECGLNDPFFGKLPLEIVNLIFQFLTLFHKTALRSISKGFLFLFKKLVAPRVVSLIYPKRFSEMSNACLVKFIRAFPQVITLSLAKCERFESFEKLIEAVPQLMNLNLSYCAMLELKHCRNLGRLKELKELNLKGLQKMNDEFLESIGKYLASLEILDVSNCSELTSFGVANFLNTKCASTSKPIFHTLILDSSWVKSDCFTLVKSSIILKKLSIQSCSRVPLLQMNIGTLELLSFSCSKIEQASLRLNNLQRIELSSNLLLKNLTLDAPNLKEIVCSNCVSLVSLRGRAPNLVFVNAFGCRSLHWGLFLDFIRPNAGKSSPLESVILNGCIQLTVPDIQALLGLAPGINEVNLEGCKSLPKSAQTRLLRKSFDEVLV